LLYADLILFALIIVPGKNKIKVNVPFISK